jgi:hypothetical protein
MSIALQMLVEDLQRRVQVLEAKKMDEGNYAELSERVQKQEGELRALKARMGKKPPE